MGYAAWRRAGYCRSMRCTIQLHVLQVTSGNVTIWYGRPVPDELALLPLGSQLDRLQPGVKLRVRAVQASNRLEATLINFE
jgi:hypothetical protein